MCIFSVHFKFINNDDKILMPRRPLTKKRTLLPDPIYNNISVHMLINRVLKSGKKSVAFRVVYNALKEIGDTTGKNPVEVFEKAFQYSENKN